MERYKIVQVLDITQPLQGHKETSIPSVVKCVVKCNEGGKILFIETEGISVGKGTVFLAEKGIKVVKMGKTKIEQQNNYIVDTKMIQNLLQNKRNNKEETKQSKTPEKGNLLNQPRIQRQEK